ncbi:MAG TPA: TonB-dependent receptor [Steroidobacteraceae bacterium]|nr:TonB-dependent receptor [Steroidobacteraceae bacterium]
MKMTSARSQVALGVALALAASSAFAQNAQTGGQSTAQNTTQTTTTGALEEVVVTARYRQENLQQTPLAITAITAEDIQQRGFDTSSDVALTVPNASFRQAQAAFGNTLTAYIRGVGQNDFNFAFEPGVAIYVDDVYYPTTMSSQFDLMDLERVEFLRGPQGTLFGRGAIGGAVRFVSKAPKGDDSGFATVNVGSFNRVDVRAGYDFALVPDSVFVRVTGMSQKATGYQKLIDFVCAFPAESGTLPAQTHNRNSGCQTGTLGGTDVQGARAQLRWVTNDVLEFGVTADYQRDNSESRADSITAIGPFIPPVAAWNNFQVNGTLTGTGLPADRPNPNFGGFGVPYDSRFIPKDPYVSYESFQDPYTGLQLPNKENLDQKGVSGTMDWKINDAVATKLILAWRNWNSAFGTDQDGSPLGFAGADGIQHFTYRTAELRFNGQAFDKKLDWTVGGFYYDGNSNSAQQVPLPAFGGPAYYSDPTGFTGNLPNALLVNGKDAGHFENTSGFAHGTYAFTDAWSLELGARYSSDKKHDFNDNTIVVQGVESDQTHFDWRAGLDWQVTHDVMLYTTASTGYRPPAFNPRPFQPTQFVAVKGDEATAYELGMKSDWFDRRMRLNIAGFYTDFTQRIIPAAGVECVKDNTGACIGPVVVPLTAYVNAPAKISGAELEFEVRPVDALHITASGGYTHFNAGTTIFQGAPFSGVTPNGEAAYVPKYNVSAAIEYTFRFANGGELTPRWDSYLQAEICSGQNVTSCTGGYTLSNVRLSYSNANHDWTIAAGAANVTNKVYYYNIFDLTPFGEPTVEAQVAPPRTWFFTVTRNFAGK